MPTTVAALLILVIAIVPGAFGNAVFSRILGTDWREREAATLARILGFSVFGLALYAWLSGAFSLPSPIHVFPKTYTSPGIAALLARVLAPAYIGHVIAGGLAGGIAAMGLRLLSKLSGRSPHPAAWDEFADELIAGRWVVVALSSGETYVGKVETLDASVDPAQRDLVLAEPALYDVSIDNYTVTPYRHLFLRASQIESIASLRNSSDDALNTVPGEQLFLRRADERNQEAVKRTSGEALAAGQQSESEGDKGRGEAEPAKLQADGLSSSATHGSQEQVRVAR